MKTTRHDVIDLATGGAVSGLWVGVSLDEATRTVVALRAEGRAGLGIIRHDDPHATAVAAARARAAADEAELAIYKQVASKREPLVKAWVQALREAEAAEEALREARAGANGRPEQQR